VKPLLEITVRGLPAPQGSKRHVGNGVMIEMSKRVKPWREAVVGAAAEARSAAGIWLLDTALRADMVFTMLRPASHYRTGRNAHLLHDRAPLCPAKAPDLSKLIRSTEDALTDAGVMRSDALIVEYGRAAKVWANEDPDALDSPGAVIRIWTIGELKAWAALDQAEKGTRA